MRSAPLELRGKASARAPYRAIVLAIPGSPDELADLAEQLDIYADGFLLPLDFAAGEPVAALAQAVAELIEARFPNRRLVLVGTGAGADVCLAVRAPAVRRVVAIAPEFESGAPSARPGPLVDLVLGPTSPLAADLRRALEANRRVRLQEVPALPLPTTPKPVIEAVKEACRRAVALHVYDDRELDEALLEAAPLNARRLAYWGPHGRVFCAAYGARSPQTAAVTLARDGALPDGTRPAEAAYDLIVVDAPASAERLAGFAALLAPDGRLACRAARIEGGEIAGLVVPEPVCETGAPILHLRRPGAAAPAERLHLFALAFAPRLMDIRTRLPSQMLRSDPELEVAYATAPDALPPIDPARPKVIVLQRPAARRAEIWRPFLADAIAKDWLTVMEFDDHPLAIADVLGHERPENPMERFGYFHAVQTSTPGLVEAFGVANPEVALFPNAVFELLPFPTRPPPRRVFYGGVLRGAFAVDVARSLAPVIEEFPDTEFVVIGDSAVLEALPTTRKSGYGYMSYEAYLSAMAQCAVSISPLEARPFLETKSDAKYLDAARAGVPTIASPIVYEDVIVDGENGLIARTAEDWPALLARVLRDPELQRRLGRKAWEDVRARRMFARQVPERSAWYRSLWARRADLHEQLMARVPGLREAVDIQRRRRP